MAGKLTDMNLPRFPRLSDDEVRLLIQAAQEGNNEARERMVHCNLRLVFHLVQRFANRGYDLEDLFQIGTIGLMKAIDKFNTAYGVQFSTYAVPMIVGEIRRFLRDDGIIKVSREEKRVLALINKERDRRQNLGLATDVHSLAEALGIAPQDVASAMFSDAHPRSLEENVFDDGDSTTLGSMIADESETVSAFDKLALRMAIESLDVRMQRIVYLRYFKDYSQAETARVLGLSQVKISREEKKIMALLESKLR